MIPRQHRPTLRQRQVVYSLTVRVTAWVTDGQEPKRAEVIAAAVDGVLQPNADTISPGAIVEVRGDRQPQPKDDER